MKNLSITHIITGLGGGGAEYMLYRLLKAHKAAGVSSSVISLTDRGSVGEKIEKLDIGLVCLGVEPGEFPRLNQIIRLIRVVKRVDPDVLQGWMYHGNLAATFAGLSKFGYLPVVWNIRQSLNSLVDERPLTRRVIRASARLSRLPDKIIYNSRVAAEQHESIGYSRTRRLLIPNGFECDNDKALIQERLPQLQNCPAGTFIVGSAARFHPKKGHSVLFNAIRIVRARGISLRLVVAGRGMDEDNQMLVELCQKLGLWDCTIWLGELSSLTQFYCSLDVFVSSSTWGEGFPNVIAEAMLSGVPCVGTDVGDTNDVISDTGIVVKPSDPEVLADGICRLLFTPESERRVLGARAARSIKTRFGMSSVGERYLSAYHDLKPSRLK